MRATVNEKCLGRIAEFQSNIDQTLTRAEAQREKHKRMYPFAKEAFVSKKRRVKENKAKARKRRHERAEKIVKECSPQSVTRYLLVM